MAEDLKPGLIVVRDAVPQANHGGAWREGKAIDCSGEGRVGEEVLRCLVCRGGELVADGTVGGGIDGEEGGKELFAGGGGHACRRLLWMLELHGERQRLARQGAGQ